MKFGKEWKKKEKMKALAILNDMKLKYNSHYIEGSDQVIKLDEALKELEDLNKESQEENRLKLQEDLTEYNKLIKEGLK